MDTEYVPFLLVTANVGSVFEDVSCPTFCSLLCRARLLPFWIIYSFYMVFSWRRRLRRRRRRWLLFCFELFVIVWCWRAAVSCWNENENKNILLLRRIIYLCIITQTTESFCKVNEFCAFIVGAVILILLLIQFISVSFTRWYIVYGYRVKLIKFKRKKKIKSAQILHQQNNSDHSNNSTHSESDTLKTTATILNVKKPHHFHRHINEWQMSSFRVKAHTNCVCAIIKTKRILLLCLKMLYST